MSLERRENVMVEKGLFSDLACLAFLLLKTPSSLFAVFLSYLF